MPNQYELTVTALDDERIEAHKRDVPRVRAAAEAADIKQLEDGVAQAEAKLGPEKEIYEVAKFEYEASLELLQILRDELAKKRAAVS